MIRQFSGFLDAAHRRTIDLFKQNSNGAQLDKAVTCYKNTLKNVPDIVGHFYVENTLPKPAFDKAEEIVNAILGAYSKSFQPNQPNQPYDWLKDDTRKGALEKIKKLAPKVGYSYSGPDDRIPSSIDQFYSGLKLDGQDYFGNQVRAKTFWAQIKLGKLYKDVDRMHMADKAPKNNADYLPGTNSVNIPAGDLQSPLFNVDFPEYLNYGGFGATTAGHEITHGLDNSGITYDETGRRSSKVRADGD
jgi:predicted metalloendopeptidase